MKKILVVFYLILISFSLFSQQLRTLPCNAPSSCSKSTIYHETSSNLGQFNYNSINYEYLVKCDQAKNIGLRIGAIYYCFPKIQCWGVPAGVNFMWGRYSNLFEIGFGATYLYIDKKYGNERNSYSDYIPYLGINGNIGYRHQNADGGLFYKFGFVPMLSIMNYDMITIISKNAFIPMISVSIGWTFKK
jgi:hypothetical protein